MIRVDRFLCLRYRERESPRTLVVGVCQIINQLS